MKKNMGITDITIRLIAAALIVALYFTNVLQGAAATVLLILAAILTLTSILGFCPIYLPFGINTRTKK